MSDTPKPALTVADLFRLMGPIGVLKAVPLRALLKEAEAAMSPQGPPEAPCK